MYFNSPWEGSVLIVALTAENLFLRKQLALYQERNQRHRRTSAADRFVLVQLSRLFDWRLALVIVKPATLVAWHRTAFRQFWHWKSRPPGRPSLPVGLKLLIGSMASDNPTWGEERIADELSLKLGIMSRNIPLLSGRFNSFERHE